MNETPADPSLIETRADSSALVTTLMSAIVLIDVIGFVLHVGRISFFLGSWGRTAAIGLEILAICGGVVACFALNLYRPLIVGALLAVFTVAQAALFSHNFGTPIHLASHATYLGWLSLLVFAPALRLLEPRRLIDILFWVTVGYAVFYILISLGVPGFQPPSTNEELLLLKSDAIGRPARFVMISSMLAFGVYISLTRIVREGRWIYAASLVLCMAAVLLSYSRLPTLIILLVVAGYVVLRNPRLLGWGGFAVFMAGGAILVFGLLSPDFYPFDIFDARDRSAAARAYEYDIVRSLIRDYWTLGVGYSPGQDETSAVVSYKWFYPADLGAVGVLYEAGVLGVVLFAVLGFVSAMQGDRFANLGFSRSSAEALALTGCACAMFGVLWPDLWGGAAALFAGLFLAAFLVDPPEEIDPEVEYVDA